MATIEKTVRFYDAVVIDSHGARHGVAADFWSKLIAAFERRTLANRSATIFEVEYFGRAMRPVRPALPHLQVERIRDLAEQLNVANITSGAVAPLDFPNPDDRVSEPTYLVPFGSVGRVAIMSPALQATRPETLGRWLTSVLDLTPQGLSLDLVPVVDPDMLNKIQGADGAVMLEVHVDAGAHIPPTGGSEVGNAFRNARQQSLSEARVVFRWSLDNSGGTESVRDSLKKGALWVAQHAFSGNAKVKLANFDTDGKLIRDELRAIFEDRITKAVKFQTVTGERTPDEVVLNAIAQAIVAFTRGGAPNYVAGVTGVSPLAIDN